MVGCVSLTPPDAPQAPPQHDEVRHKSWWNFYLRGRERLFAGRFEDASQDFRIALGLAPGSRNAYKKDTWYVRTYGVHHLLDYFPHRELGICLFHLGEREGSEELLLRSISLTPSARASYYLNQVRAVRLRQQDRIEPMIVLDQETRLSSERTLRLRGVAKDTGYVNALAISGRREFIELAEPERRFDAKLPLRAGENTFELTAEDLAGNQRQQQVRCFADWVPPGLSVSRTKVENGRTNLELVLTDNHSLKQLGWQQDGGVAQVERATGKQSHAFQINCKAQGVLQFVLFDEAGNKVSGSIDPMNPRLLAQAQAMSYLQYAQAPTGGDPAVAREAEVLEANPSRDELRPSLRVAPLTAQVARDEFFLQASAEDGSGLRSLTINGEEQLQAEDRDARKHVCARRVPLEEGANTFRVVATDKAGNRSEKIVRVRRVTPTIQESAYRLSMALPSFASTSSSSSTSTSSASSSTTSASGSMTSSLAKQHVEEALISPPARFNLLERDDGWESVLEEQRISVSSLADPSRALRAAKIIPAELVLVSSMIEEGEGVTILSRVIDTAQGKIIASEDVYAPTRDDSALQRQAGGLALKVEQHFPLLEGEVLQVSGKTVRLSLGSSDGVRPGMKFLLAWDPKNPEHVGEVKEVGGSFVQVVVTQTQSEQSVAKLQLKADVSKGDVVYAR